MDETTILLTDEDGNEYPMHIECTFDSEDGTKHFALLSDPSEEEDNVYAFRYNEETGEICEVDNPDDFEQCAEVLDALMSGEEDGDEEA